MREGVRSGRVLLRPPSPDLSVQVVDVRLSQGPAPLPTSRFK